MAADNATPVSMATLADMQADYVIITGRLAGETDGGKARKLVKEVKRVLHAMPNDQQTSITLTSRWGLGDITLDLAWLDPNTFQMTLRAVCECGNPVSLCHPEA